jgi:SAM-dependent MidA family methyltransferase
MRVQGLADPTADADATGLRNFAREHKSDAGYLDVAANTHGAEKGLLVHRALGRIQHPQPRVVEVGPGGGAAVTYLAAQLAGDPDPTRVCT